MKTVRLKNNVSMIEVMRRFHNSEAIVIKAMYYKGQRPKKVEEDDFDDDGRKKIRKIFDNPYWSIQYIGTQPNLSGLMQ